MNNEPRYCATCDSYDFNAEHICVVYDGPPCVTCQAPTVFVTIAAPGIGQGWSCKNNHFHGKSRLLTAEEAR